MGEGGYARKVSSCLAPNFPGSPTRVREWLYVREWPVILACLFPIPYLAYAFLSFCTCSPGLLVLLCLDVFLDVLIP